MLYSGAQPECPGDVQSARANLTWSDKASLEVSRMPKELDPSQLRCPCDPSSFAFESTDEVSTTPEIVGQPRATAALEFGLGMNGQGYHVFVAGPRGTGKM